MEKQLAVLAAVAVVGGADILSLGYWLPHERDTLDLLQVASRAYSL
tara:strand:- start:529 stop:666 length:138 start_codon:yes stop_codon:yes gene_type:complete